MSTAIPSTPRWYQDYLSESQALEVDSRRQKKWNAILQGSEDGPEFLASLKSLPIAQALSFDQDVVTIGSPAEISDPVRASIHGTLENMKPWKKGPFSIFGTLIDSEWRSDLKWARFEASIGSLENHVVADIGCHNGYFMFRMLPHRPRVVVGFEPVIKHWKTFHFLNAMANQSNLFFETLGVEELDAFPQVFDTIFCLGILYHHTDPVGLLRKLREALKPEGTLWIDCQGIPGNEPHALIPKNRYAGARGIWFLPTRPALYHWVRRAGFQNIETIYAGALSVEEQRSTEWAPIRSLQEFLDPKNPNLTIEGYPAPYRFYLKVQ